MRMKQSSHTNEKSHAPSFSLVSQNIIYPPKEFNSVSSCAKILIWDFAGIFDCREIKNLKIKFLASQREETWSTACMQDFTHIVQDYARL